MGFKFTLVLSREITDDESAILQEANNVVPVFGADRLPTNADVPVTKMDFDDLVSPSLEEAIESALQSVKKVEELSVPGLTVPAQPAFREEEDKPIVVAGDNLGGTAEAEPAAKKPAAKKPGAKKPAAKQADKDQELVEATTGA